MATGQRVDPYGGFNFLVEIGNLVRGAFHEASGLDSTIDVIEHREGGPPSPKKYPGLTKYSNITLKRGVTDDLTLYNWHLAAVNGRIERLSGSILLLDRRGQEVARWNFRDGWPCKCTGPALNSEGNNIAIESIEICHEGLERVR